jgi:hypothetical protein
MRKLNLAFVSLLTVAGCSQVIGLSDYDIVDPETNGTGGSGVGVGGGGSPGDGGVPQTGGKGQAGGGASHGGEPGGGSDSAGEAGAGGGSAGQAGAGGEGAEPPSSFVGCDGEPFDGNEAIVRSCVLRVSCQYWRYPNDTISRCISQNTQNAYEGTKCTLDAETCDDIAACEGVRLERTFCADKPNGQYCNGNEVVTCGVYDHARDCVKEGGTCKDFGVELASGDTVDCELPSVTACTATTDTAECGGPQNGYKYQCEGTTAYGTKCSNFAASCQEVGGDIGCYYPLNECTEEGVTCTNGRATWCDGDSKVTYDCGSVGLGCTTEGDYYADNGRQCAAPGCTPEDVRNCRESCDGTKLTVCYGGAPVTVDCADYGFDACLEYNVSCEDTSMNDCLYTSDTIHFADCEYEE